MEYSVSFPIKQFKYKQYLLEVFLLECEKELLNSENINEIVYPKGIRKETWENFQDKILNDDNKRILDYVQNRDGIYAIHIKRKKLTNGCLDILVRKEKIQNIDLRVTLLQNMIGLDLS